MSAFGKSRSNLKQRTSRAVEKMHSLGITFDESVHLAVFKNRTLLKSSLKLGSWVFANRLGVAI